MTKTHGKINWPLPLSAHAFDVAASPIDPKPVRGLVLGDQCCSLFGLAVCASQAGLVRSENRVDSIEAEIGSPK